jgi:hypothetical protein
LREIQLEQNALPPPEPRCNRKSNIPLIAEWEIRRAVRLPGRTRFAQIKPPLKTLKAKYNIYCQSVLALDTGILNERVHHMGYKKTLLKSKLTKSH